MVQNEKRFCLLNSISQEPYIMWLSFVVDKCKIIPPGFFSFFQNFDFLVSGIKGQKMAQNDKNFCLLHLISQESLFIVHLWKRKYFLILSIFGANSGVKRQKLTQNDKKLCVAPMTEEACTILSWFLDTYITWCHLHMLFSYFENFDFLGC